MISEKKYPVDSIRGKKILARKYLATFLHWKKVPFMACNAEKKNLTPLHVRKKNSFTRDLGKIIPLVLPSPTPQKSNGRLLIKPIAFLTFTLPSPPSLLKLLDTSMFQEDQMVQT